MTSATGGVAGTGEPGLKQGIYLALARWRLRAGFIFPLLCLLVGHPQWVMFWVGAVLIVLGALLRLLSAGVIRKNEELTHSGTYALCRNPLYLGTLVIQLGFGLLSGSFVLSVLGFIFFLWLYHLVIAHEERWLLQHFGGAYLAYMRRVPRILPGLHGWRELVALRGFSWQRMLFNRELPSTAVALIGILIFLLKYALGWNLPFSLW